MTPALALRRYSGGHEIAWPHTARVADKSNHATAALGKAEPTLPMAAMRSKAVATSIVASSSVDHR